MWVWLKMQSCFVNTYIYNIRFDFFMQEINRNIGTPSTPTPSGPGKLAPGRHRTSRHNPRLASREGVSTRRASYTYLDGRTWGNLENFMNLVHLVNLVNLVNLVTFWLGLSDGRINGYFGDNQRRQYGIRKNRGIFSSWSTKHLDDPVKVRVDYKSGIEFHFYPLMQVMFGSIATPGKIETCFQNVGSIMFPASVQVSLTLLHLLGGCVYIICVYPSTSPNLGNGESSI